MKDKLIVLGFCLVALAVSATAQTTVTTSGTTSSGTVPVFNGTATVTNSPIAVSGSSVGIGTAGPSYKLDISGGDINLSNNQALRHAGTWTIGSDGTTISIGSLATARNIGIYSAGNGTPAIYANTSGNVGIGTMPNYVLDIRRDVVGVSAINLLNNDTTAGDTSALQLATPNGTWSLHANRSGGFGIDSAQPIANVFYINNLGNVGIGTTNPADKLEIDGTSAGLLRLYNTTGAGSQIDSLDNQWSAHIVQNSGNLSFQTGGAVYTPLYLSSGGNVGIGTTNPQAKLEINGTLRFTADGSVQTTAWTGVLCGGDYAEAMNAAGGKAKYQPGDVLVLASDDSDDVQKSSEPYSTMVAGIYATKPGVIGRREALAKSKNDIPMAMVGVVPTKVSAENGPIRKGDLLVSSSTPGYAMKGTDRSRMLGAVIGKAMQPLESGQGVIEVLVTLQ